MGRITLDGKVSQYSTGEDVQPKFWDANKGRAVIHGQNPETHRVERAESETGGTGGEGTNRL